MDKNIQYILEVARCGGITRAAEKLYITPSALSKFVQAREEEMNIRLFRRLGKKFVLTDAGQYYVRKCEVYSRPFLMLPCVKSFLNFRNITQK